MPKTSVYFVPGLAAGGEIFKNIRFPKETHEVFILEWLLPTSSEESLSAYAKRMAARVVKKNAVLVGVSFGGVMAHSEDHVLYYF